MFLKLQEAFNSYDEFDNFDLLEIITGIDREELLNLDSDKDIDSMLEATSFIFEMMGIRNENTGGQQER